jgi:hypothetical protein
MSPLLYFIPSGVVELTAEHSVFTRIENETVLILADTKAATDILSKFKLKFIEYSLLVTLYYSLVVANSTYSKDARTSQCVCVLCLGTACCYDMGTDTTWMLSATCHQIRVDGKVDAE